jgi:hypothetical protein
MLAKYMLPKQFKAIEGSLLINIMTLICAKIMYQSIISGREDNVLPVASPPFWSLTQAAS